jgi:hypothetical protein
MSSIFSFVRTLKNALFAANATPRIALGYMQVSVAWRGGEHDNALV